MPNVNQLKYNLNIKDLNGSGDIGSPIKESYIVGEPDDYQLALLIAENGTIILHDVANEMLYSNKNISVVDNQISFQ